MSVSMLKLEMFHVPHSVNGIIMKIKTSVWRDNFMKTGRPPANCHQNS